MYLVIQIQKNLYEVAMDIQLFLLTAKYICPSHVLASSFNKSLYMVPWLFVFLYKPSIVAGIKCTRFCSDCRFLVKSYSKFAGIRCHRVNLNHTFWLSAVCFKLKYTTSHIMSMWGKHKSSKLSLQLSKLKLSCML